MNGKSQQKLPYIPEDIILYQYREDSPIRELKILTSAIYNPNHVYCTAIEACKGKYMIIPYAPEHHHHVFLIGRKIT